MPAEPAIIFIHRWPFQRYLRVALEQARAANPRGRIYLLCDQRCTLPAAWGIAQVLFSELLSAQLAQFKQQYYHVSTNTPEFELFCFERWFYVEQLLQREKIEQALHVDSDCMLTASATDVFARFGQAPGLHICRNGLPHCAPLRGSLQPMLDFFVSTFDPAKKPAHEARMAQAKAQGQTWVLSDMFVMRDYLAAGGAGSFYWYDTHTDVVITSVMSDADGYEVWPGKRTLKRVHWQVENGLLTSYLTEAATRRRVRVYALHYKGAAKRRMMRFNPLRPVLPAAWRAAWHNHMAPVNGPRWVA